MDRKAVAVASVIVLLIGGGLLFTLSGGSDDPADTGTTSGQVAADDSTETESATNDGSLTAKQKAMSGGEAMDGASAAGSYVDYSSELVQSTPGEKLLFFHASWCPQCQELEADIEGTDLPDGLTIFKVDYDSNQDLRQEYGVTLQTTIVKVDDNGEMVDSFVAYDDPSFENVEQALLK